MSIKALPADTCRLLGSTTLIATPLSLVKELVDNAVDAGATSVEVLVSPNTVDKVEVRDNGRGIALADFDALGRRGHTSKLRRLEDLKTVGGISLGFRGEGLASANTLGYVAITTRTASDAVASTFRLAPNLGGVSSGSRKPASAPVGTTVSVTCLFAALPVRRKVAVQEVAKTAAAIKAFLCGYALARPWLRLAFRVFQQAAPAWCYRPAAGGAATEDSGSVREAVLMLFGAEVARQCREVVVSTAELLDGQSILSQSLAARHAEKKNTDFVFEVCLPHLDADLSKLKLGGFVSVDRRPLSGHQQGVAKKLLAIFHASLGKYLMHQGPQQTKVRDIFMRLNIICPAGSYDANVESSKSDVLFVDEKLVCDAFEKLCGKLCAEAEGARGQSQAGNISSSPLQQQQATLTYSGNVPNTVQHQARNSLLREQPTLPNMTSLSNLAPRRNNGQPSSSQLSSMFTETARATKQSTRVASGRPVEYDFTSPRSGALRSNSTFRRHAPVPPPLRREYRSSVSTRGLQTPPASPVEEHSRDRATRQRYGSPESAGLPGLVSNDGLRQTTISFGGQARARRSQGQDVNQERLPENGPPASGNTPSNTDTHRPSFVTASELHRQEQVEKGLPPSSVGLPRNVGLPMVPTVNPSETRAAPPNLGLHQGQGRAELEAPTIQGLQPAKQVALKRAVCTMEVDIQELRRSAARFARNARAWEEDQEYLSPDVADISSIESRLRAAIAGWLAKTRTERKGAGEGPVQVEFYLRKSLKKKALAVRNLGL